MNTIGIIIEKLVCKARSADSGRGGRGTAYLKVRGYTGQDTQVLWGCPSGVHHPIYLFYWKLKVRLLSLNIVQWCER